MSYSKRTFADNDLLTAARMNRLVENTDHVYQQLPQFVVEDLQGLKTGKPAWEARQVDIFSGNVERAAGGRILVAKINFRTPFSSFPIVTAQYVSNDINYREVSVMVNGLSGEKHPSKTGFTVHLTHNKGSAAFPAGSPTNQYFIHYHAVGIV